jgi:large subunit ribosomal protein L31
MKKDTHPNYFETEVKCACGAQFQVKSVKKTMHVDICNQCHPFFTGKQKLLDAAGRVDKFNRRYGLAKN